MEDGGWRRCNSYSQWKARPLLHPRYGSILASIYLLISTPQLGNEGNFSRGLRGWLGWGSD